LTVSPEILYFEHEHRIKALEIQFSNVPVYSRSRVEEGAEEVIEESKREPKGVEEAVEG